MRIEHAPASRLDDVRRLFREYADSLGFDLAFQEFERELRELPGEYAPPRGRLLIALAGEEPAGCVALRRLADDVCEMKRLYVRPAFRARGVGRALAEAALRDARAIGYRSMRLDTVPAMREAQTLYRSLGFSEIPAYTFNPIPGTTFMELTL